MMPYISALAHLLSWVFFFLPDILQSFMGAWSHIYLNLLDVFYFYLQVTLTFQLKIQDIQVILYKASFYMIR